MLHKSHVPVSQENTVELQILYQQRQEPKCSQAAWDSPREDPQSEPAELSEKLNGDSTQRKRVYKNSHHCS